MTADKMDVSTMVLLLPLYFMPFFTHGHPALLLVGRQPGNGCTDVTHRSCLYPGAAASSQHSWCISRTLAMQDHHHTWHILAGMWHCSLGVGVGGLCCCSAAEVYGSPSGMAMLLLALLQHLQQ